MGSQALGIKVQRLSVNNHQRVAIIAPVLFRTRAKQQTSHPMCWHGFVGKRERRHRLWKRLRPHGSRPWRWSDRREGEEGRHFVCRKENQDTTTFRAVDALATEVFRVISMSWKKRNTGFYHVISKQTTSALVSWHIYTSGRFGWTWIRWSIVSWLFL